MSVTTLAVASAAYALYASLTPGGARGGSAMGIGFGVVGSAMMLFAGLLGARKKVRIWRLGRAQTWMRGHLWLGALSLPMIFFHAGFHMGGLLTQWLMWLLVIVVASGVLGATLQHFMPRRLTQQLPMETIYEQIDRVELQLLDEARLLVAEGKSRLGGNLASSDEGDRALAARAGTMGGVTVASALQIDRVGSEELTRFFEIEIEPFLAGSASGNVALAARETASQAFRRLRVSLSPSVESVVNDLENLCDERRQLQRQRKMHHILHGWLLVHIPLSYALLVLGAIHAVAALRY